MKKKPENNGLTPKQHQAVVELMKPLRRSYQEVSKVLGISSRCLFNWRREPEFQQALDKAQSELKERVFSSSEFDIKMHTLEGSLSTGLQILNALDITESIFKIAENQVRLRERLKALMEEVERLKSEFLEKGLP
jgi:Helix-turn-helix of insertion element transposase